MQSGIKNKYYPILKKNYSDIAEKDVAFLDDGNDHYVFVVDQRHAFRFPRTKQHGKNDHVENIFLKTFARTSPVPIQIMTGRVDSATGIGYQTYEFLPGISLTPDLARSLLEEELTAIAKDLGKFLTRLHACSIDEARKMGMDSLISPQDYAKYFRAILEVDKNAIAHLLTQKEWEWIEKLIGDFVMLSYEHPYEFRVTHSDMLPEHIIIDEKTHQLSGIIDFSLRIADPANDFKSFHRYGDMFLRIIFDNYPPVDAYFDKRRLFYSGDFYVAKLYESVSNKNEKTIPIHLKQLRDYIASHI